MMINKNSDPVQQSDALDRTLKQNPDLNKSIAELFKYSQRSRQFMKWLLVSFVLDILLTIGLIFVFERTNHNALQIQRTNILAAATCQSTNIVKDTDAQLWNYILNLPPDSTQHLTPEQQAEQDKRIADFKVYIGEKFAQKKCDV